MVEQSLEEVRREATVLLSRFVDPALFTSAIDMARQLEPRPDDYAKVFVAEVVEQIRAGYQLFWESLPPWPARPEQTRLHVEVVRAEELAEDTAQARQFPGGYRSMAAQSAARPWAGPAR